MGSEIDDYFAQFTYHPPPAGGTKPLEVVWKRVGAFRVEGTRLYIGDSWAIAAESIEIPITPGTYDINAQCFSYGTDGRVAVLRGRLQGASPDGSREAGQFGVDVASAGVIDADAVDRWAAADEPAFEARFLDEGQGYFDDSFEILALRARPRSWKEKLAILWAAPAALVALVVGVTLGLFGLAMLKIANLLKRLQR